MNAIRQFPAHAPLRILVALGLLALLASFDGAEDAAAAAQQPASTGISHGRSQ